MEEMIPLDLAIPGNASQNASTRRRANVWAFRMRTESADGYSFENSTFRVWRDNKFDVLEEFLWAAL